MAKDNFTFDMSMVKARARHFLRQHPVIAEAAMEDVAMFGEGEAKDRAAVREGFLTGDIHGETQRDGNQIAAVIKIPVNSTSSAYGPHMHEGDYNLGELSLAKQAKIGKVVGKKFITRAIDENRDEIRKIIIDKMKVDNYG